MCAVVLLSTSGCNFIFPKVSNSDLREHERVHLRVTEDKLRDDAKIKLAKPWENPDPAAPGGMAAAAVGAALLPIVADYAIEATKKELKEEAAKHTASYAQRTSREFFKVYDEKQAFAHVNLKSFRLVRYADDEPQFFAEYVITPSTKADAFKLTLHRIAIRGAKAKVFYPRWWTKVLIYGFFQSGHEAVDVKLTADLEAVWTGNQQTIHTQTIAHMDTAPIRMSLDGSDSLKMSDIDPDAKDPAKEWGGWSQQELNQEVGWFPAVPVAVWTNGSAWGLGTYNLSVTAVESDDFGKYITNGADLLDKNKDKIIQKIVEFSKKQSEKDETSMPNNGGKK